MTQKIPQELIQDALENYAEPKTNKFVSEETEYTNGTVVSFAHGLGAIPKSFSVRAVCKVAEGGLLVGDEFEVFTLWSANINNAFGGFNTVNDTQVNCIVTSLGLHAATTTSFFALTPANFRLIARAEL